MPLLIGLYLLKLRRRPVRVSSVYLWAAAEDDLQTNVPFRWLRPSWLLLLHLVIVALFALALGRPMIGGDHQADRTVIIIDHSASMSALDGAPTDAAATPPARLDAAKARARELVTRLTRSGWTAGDGRGVAIISSAAEPLAITGLTTSTSLLIDAIDSITPTDEPGDLNAALALAEAISRRSAAEAETEDSAPARARVILLSDGAPSPDAGTETAGIDLEIERFGGQSPGVNSDNAGIIAIAARRGFDDPAVVRVLARFGNAASAPRTVPIIVTLDDRVAVRRALNLPSRPESGGKLGEAIAEFDVEAPRGGLIGVRIDREDILASDNAAFLVVAPPTTPRVLLVRATRSAGQGQDAAKALAAGLLADVVREWTPSVREISEADWAAAAVDAGLGLENVDLVVFEGGVGERWPARNSLSFGPPPMTDQGLRFEDSSLRDEPPPFQILLWDRGHPVLRGISLDNVLLSRAFWMSIAAAGSDRAADAPAQTRPASSPATDLARGRAGTLIALAERDGRRHLVVGFPLSESNWPLEVSFALFVAQASEFLTGRGDGDAGRAFQAGAPASLNGPRGPGRLLLRGPVDFTVDAAPSADGVVKLGRIARAGVYRVDGLAPVDPSGNTLAVNIVDAAETAVPTPFGTSDGVGDRPGVRSTEQREIWPWFVLAATALLVVEWLVYAAKMRA